MDGILTHSKVATVAANGTVTIRFNSANGTLINCNTMYLAVSDVATSGYLLVVPSGISSFTSATVGNGASGTFGIWVDTKEPHWITLGHGKTCQAVVIRNDAPVAKTILISYGIRTVSNAIWKGHNPGV